MSSQMSLIIVVGALAVLGAGAGAMWLVIGRMRSRSREIHHQIVGLNQRLDARTGVVDDKLTSIHERVATFEEQQERDRRAAEERIDELAARLEGIGDRLDGANARLDHGDARQEDVSRSLGELDGRLQPLEALDLGSRVARADKLRDIERAADLLNLALLDGSLPVDCGAELLRHLLELGEELEASPVSGRDDS